MVILILPTGARANRTGACGPYPHLHGREAEHADGGMVGNELLMQLDRLDADDGYRHD
jgi:hypothetical protein